MEDERAELPSAAELEISEAAYERILRDLHQRQVEGRQGPLLAEALPPVEPPPEGVAVPRPEPMAPPPHPLVERYRAGWRPSPVARRREVAFRLGVGAVVVALMAMLALSLGRSGWGARDGGGSYEFLDTYADRPVAYSSCRQIQVAVYPAGGPPTAEALVREAVGQVRSATGLDIVVIGAFGGHAPNWNLEAAPVTPTDPIGISWQDKTAIARLTDDTAGLGGSYTVASASGVPYLVAGSIALSRDYYAELDAEGDHSEQLAVLLHEFGHVFGLAHVQDPGELMYEHNIGRRVYGKGDLAGLRQLGEGPCV